MSVLRVYHGRSLWWLLRNIERASVWEEFVVANLSLSEAQTLSGRHEFSSHLKAVLPSRVGIKPKTSPEFLCLG